MINRLLAAKLEKTIIEIEGLHCSYINALRRILLAEVPVLAIDYLKFYINNTVLSEEIIANRLGLIPIANGAKLLNYVKPEETLFFEKKLNTRNSVRFLLEHTNTELAVETVFSHHIKFKNALQKKQITELATMVTEGKLPILKLARNQRLKIEGYALMGLGKDHAKWSCVSTAFYKFVGDKVEFVIESAGQYDSRHLFITSNLVLISKLEILLEELAEKEI